LNSISFAAPLAHRAAAGRRLMIQPKQTIHIGVGADCVSEDMENTSKGFECVDLSLYRCREFVELVQRPPHALL